MHTTGKREARPFTLTEHVCTERLDVSSQPESVLLVVSGRVTCERLGKDYGAGEMLSLEGKDVLYGDVRLWQITGQAKLISSLRRFSAQLVRKDAATAVHAARVARLAADMGCYLGLSRARLEHLSLAAYLHDLGKLTLSTELLRTSEHLTPGEWMLMRAHPLAGKQLLETTPLASLGLMVEQHHERLDGSGYPFGLKGDEVSLESYIVAVADTFDAMTHDRPYRRAQSRTRASAEINHYSGVLFPHEVVNALNAITGNVTTVALTAQRAR